MFFKSVHKVEKDQLCLGFVVHLLKMQLFIRFLVSSEDTAHLFQLDALI